MFPAGINRYCGRTFTSVNNGIVAGVSVCSEYIATRNASGPVLRHLTHCDCQSALRPDLALRHHLQDWRGRGDDTSGDCRSHRGKRRGRQPHGQQQRAEPGGELRTARRAPSFKLRKRLKAPFGFNLTRVFLQKKKPHRIRICWTFCLISTYSVYCALRALVRFTWRFSFCFGCSLPASSVSPSTTSSRPARILGTKLRGIALSRTFKVCSFLFK